MSEILKTRFEIQDFLENLEDENPKERVEECRKYICEENAENLLQTIAASQTHIPEVLIYLYDFLGKQWIVKHIREFISAGDVKNLSFLWKNCQLTFEDLPLKPRLTDNMKLSVSFALVKDCMLYNQDILAFTDENYWTLKVSQSSVVFRYRQDFLEKSRRNLCQLLRMGHLELIDAHPGFSYEDFCSDEAITAALESGYNTFEYLLRKGTSTPTITKGHLRIAAETDEVVLFYRVYYLSSLSYKDIPNDILVTNVEILKHAKKSIFPPEIFQERARSLIDTSIGCGRQESFKFLVKEFPEHCCKNLGGLCDRIMHRPTCEEESEEAIFMLEVLQETFGEEKVAEDLTKVFDIKKHRDPEVLKYLIKRGICTLEDIKKKVSTLRELDLEYADPEFVILLRKIGIPPKDILKIYVYPELADAFFDEI